MAAAAYPAAFFMRTQRARAHPYAGGTATVDHAAGPEPTARRAGQDVVLARKSQPAADIVAELTSGL